MSHLWLINCFVFPRWLDSQEDNLSIAKSYVAMGACNGQVFFSFLFFFFPSDMEHYIRPPLSQVGSNGDDFAHQRAFLHYSSEQELWPLLS